MRRTPYTEEEILRIVSRLQSVPGIRTLMFREGCGFPHIMVMRQNLVYYFWLAPKGYEGVPGEYDYKYWFPFDRAFIVSSAEDVLRHIKLKVTPGTIQNYKKQTLFRETA